MLQRIRESLALLLIILLPFHALIVTVFTKVIAGPGHAPLGWLAVWKEALLALICLIAFIEWIKECVTLKCPVSVLRDDFLKKIPQDDTGQSRRVDVIDGIILFLIFLSLALFAYRLPLSATSFIYGFKYDFLSLLAFLILRRVAWSDAFMERMMKMLLIVGGIVAAYGILTLYLPASFFHFLGYSDAHSLYLPDQPLSAFQQISNSALKRIQGPMSGPNQLGIWLLIPIGILLACVGPSRLSCVCPSRRAGVMLRRLAQSGSRLEAPALLRMTQGDTVKYFLLLFLLLLALFLSFSRSAWIGAAVMFVIAFWPLIRPRISLYLASPAVALAKVGIVLLLLLLFVAAFPSTLIRLSSSRGHIERPLQAIRVMIAHPLGLGLGSAGPAANRTHDPCVILRPQDDPSWAKSQPDLCVFLGPTQQVQPPLPSRELRPASQPHAKVCNCPLLPENWYLQIGVEMGWVGMGLYVFMVVLLLYKLREASSFEFRAMSTESSIFSRSFMLILLAVSIAALFLHAWEDAAVAYTVWMLLAMRLQVAARY